MRGGDELRRFALRRTVPPPTWLPVSDDDSEVEMWVVAPPLTHLEVDLTSSSSDDSLTSSGYNDECPHVKEVSCDQLFIHYNCLLYIINY
jgi:hypothetical protein